MIVVTSQSPKIPRTDDERPSSVGSSQINEALKMCVRPVSGRPQSRSGFWLSRVAFPRAGAPPLSVKLKFARERDSVYDVWNCDPWPKRLMNCVWSEWYVDLPP